MELGLQVIKTDPGLQGQTVVISTPITLHKDDVLRFLVMLLEQRDYTMVQDRSGIYIIQPRNMMQAGVTGGELSPTQIIPTPGIRPNSLQAVASALAQQAGDGRAGPRRSRSLTTSASS